MNKRIIVTASIFGILAVVFGAFGAHSLKTQVNSSDLQIWKTAVDYQFYHTFALIFLSTFSRFKKGLINLSFWFFVLGIIFFSGSLYLLATKSLMNTPLISILGPVTPIGGLFFILGWISLLLAALKNK
jgi:uncharacterized membrane protein YgdD (TMEM256/DUF423 family)